MWRPFGNSKFDLQRKCLEIIVDKAREGEENVTVALWHNPKTCRIEPPPTEVVQAVF